MEKILLTRKEAAHALSISVWTLDRYIALKELPARRFGRKVLVHVNDVERFARRDHDNARQPTSVEMQGATA
jgi:excisionase family DNA binding protein